MDKKISQLTAATTPLSGTEQLPIVQGGVTVKATAQDIADLAPPPTEWLYVSSPVNKVFRLDGTNDGKNKYTDPDDATNTIYWNSSEWDLELNNQIYLYTEVDTEIPGSLGWYIMPANEPTTVSITRYTGTLQEVLEAISKPKEWPKVYKCLLSQVAANAPVPIILENTLGDIVWTRTSAGQYTGTLANAFSEAKTLLFITPHTWDGAMPTYIGGGYESENTVRLLISEDLGNTTNYGASLEILVYP